MLGLSPDEPADSLKWEEEGKPRPTTCSPIPITPCSTRVVGEKRYGKTYMGVIRSHWIIDEDGTVVDAQIKVSPTESVERATQFLAG